MIEANTITKDTIAHFIHRTYDFADCCIHEVRYFWDEEKRFFSVYMDVDCLSGITEEFSDEKSDKLIYGRELLKCYLKLENVRAFRLHEEENLVTSFFGSMGYPEDLVIKFYDNCFYFVFRGNLDGDTAEEVSLKSIKSSDFYVKCAAASYELHYLKDILDAKLESI